MPSGGGDPTSVDIVGDPMVTVRPDAFRRMLFNLVSNASRYGTRIAISANHETRWLFINVDDDGPGIPPAARDEVFKPFVRLDEARNQDEGGSGLGLAIVAGIVRAHSGRVDVVETPGGGATFRIAIPLADDAAVMALSQQLRPDATATGDPQAVVRGLA